MKKTQSKPIYGDIPVDQSRHRIPWSDTHGMMIAGRAYIDEADLTASQMEAKWGADRLRLLVDPELREKFDRQRYLFNQAVWHGDLEAVRREAQRMVKAWFALDRVATAAGKAKIDPQVWEVALADGSVAAIVPDNLHAGTIMTEGRKMAVYTLEEIGRLLSEFPAIAAAKTLWPGAMVTAVGRNIVDPLASIDGTSQSLDDDIPF